MLSQTKGITLVELLIVVVVLGTIASISAVAVGNVVDNTRRRADHASVIGLNQATYYFAITNPNQVKPFAELEDDELRMTWLQDSGFLSAPAEAQHRDSDFFFNPSLFLWCNVVCASNQTLYDFSTESLIISGGNSTHQGHWTYQEEGYLEGRHGITFIDNPRSEYTIIVEAQLEPGSAGGYGVLFETVINDINDVNDHDGYVLQFDRGLKQIVVRQRVAGAERNPVLRINVTFDGNTVIYTPTGNNQSNPDTTNHAWWGETHTIMLRVQKAGANQKTLTIWIDGQLVYDNWNIPNPLDDSMASENKTGLRAWSIESRFYRLEIQD